MNEILNWAASVDPRIALVAYLGVLNLWAATLVVLSTAALRDKILWVAILLLMPIIGAVFWFVFGPKWRPRTD